MPIRFGVLACASDAHAAVLPLSMPATTWHVGEIRPTTR